MADGNFYPGGCFCSLVASWRTIILLSFIFGNFIRLEEIFLLSQVIDTLAHSWPRGELLLAAFSTSVIYPRGVASKDLQNGHLTYNFRHF